MEILSLAEIRSEVQNLIERSDSTMQTRIDGYINQRYRNVYRRRPWYGVCRQLTQAQVSGQNYVILPAWVVQVIDIHQTQTPIVLALRRYYNWLKQNIDATSEQGNPVQALPDSKIGVMAALPDDGTLTVESDNAGDTTQLVRIRGYNSDGVPVTESVSLNGTTPATSSNSYSSTIGQEPWFSKDADTTGVIIIKRGSTVLARIGPEQRAVHYNKWRLWPEPNSGNNLFFTVKKGIQKLTQSEDTPEIDHIGDALIQGAFAQCLEEKRQFKKAGVAWEHYEEEIDLAIGKEPIMSENAQDQMMPDVQRSDTDTHWA